MTAFTEEQAAAIISLRRAFPGEKLVVIGSVGLGCHLPNAWRRTNDIDLTIAVEFNRFGLLRASAEWKADTALEYRFTHENGLRVDLLPSAKRYLDEGAITFAHTGQVMNLMGFDLALQHTVEIALPRGDAVSVATVPVITVLKMAAFLDRPWERERDLQDLAAVFLHYLEPTDDRRWEPPLDEGIEFSDQSAMALGIDIARIAGPLHHALVTRFLAALAPDTPHRARLVKVSAVSLDERDETVDVRTAQANQR